jgi:hypothetical protein
MASTLIDGVVFHDSFATPATPGTSALVDGINNQQFSTAASATAQPVDGVLGLSTWTFSGGGAVSYALSGASGSYAATGNAGAFKVGRLLSGAAAAYSLTGQSGTFKVGHTLPGSAGAYAVTGNAGVLSLARKLAGANGTYALSGVAATLTYTPGAGAVAYSLSGAAGSYAVSGIAATLKTSRALSGSAGAYAATGQSGTLLLARKLSGSAGAYALAGNAGTFTYTSIGPVAYALAGDAGSYTLAGSNAELAASGQAVFIVTPGSRFAQPARGETEAQKRKRRIEQGIIQDDVPAPQPIKVKPDPLAEHYVSVLQDSIDEARAANALARQYIAKLNAQIDAQEIARQQIALQAALEQEARAQQDLEDFDIAYIAALMAVL